MGNQLKSSYLVKKKMYKLLNQIAALAIVPQVLSRQLTNFDISRNWIELTDSKFKEYDKDGGLFLTPGKEVKLGIKYDEKCDEKWHRMTGDYNEAWTIKEEV